jgi:hypothetical protein
VIIAEFLDLARAMPDVEVLTPGPGSEAPEVAWGDSFMSYQPPEPLPGDEREFPFATVVTKDYPGFDTSSRLDREGVFRLNFAVGRRDFERLLGYPPADHAAHRDRYDPAAVGVVIPHPEYGVQGWVSLVCSGEGPAEPATSLLHLAYERAVRRHHSRLVRRRGE